MLPILLLPFLLLLQGPPARPKITAAPALDSLVMATGFPGTILLYDSRTGVTSGGGGMATQGFLPASTFKIYNSLIGLEAGVVAGPEHVFRWDGQPRRLKVWEKDLALREAFQASCVPCFRELARMIGEKRMRQGLRKLGYGNQDMREGLDLFWLQGAMRITPLQQLRLVARLAQSRLPFSKKTQETVQGLMLLEEKGGRSLHGKTGWAQVENHDTGWFVGWVRQNSGFMAFVSLLDAEDPDDSFGAGRKKLAEDALRWARAWE